MKEIGVNNVSQYTNELPCTHLHCDYGFSNVNYKSDHTFELVVLDSSPNKFVTFKTGVIGPIYIDIGNMIACIEGLVPLLNYPFMNWQLLPEIREYFLDGYRSNSKNVISSDWINRFSYATAKCYLLKKYPGKLLHKLALQILFNSYKGNVPPIINTV
jgi:hypothetical protein